MPITNRSKKWEILNSLWIMWSFFYPFNFIGFFIIGYGVKNKRWKLIGCALLVTCFIIPVFVVGTFGSDSIILDITVFLSLISIIAGVILSFKYRKEYLIRKDLILSNAKYVDEELVNKIKNEYNYTHTTNNNLNKQKTEDENKGILQNNTDRIDINTCSEESLLQLPGINIVTAKKTIDYRNTHNGFSSFEQFVEVMDIKPHFAIQLKDLITINSIEIKKNNTNKSGRKLDI